LLTLLQNYQQPIDITIGPNEKVYFTVTGTHTIHLTGNYIIDTSEDIESGSEDDDEEYDFPDALEEMYGEGSDESEDDELDGLEDPRVKEIESDDEVEAAPKAAEPKKGKNKRPADDEVEGLDDMMAKAATEQTKLTKKQQKKLKNNKGEPIAVEEKTAAAPGEKSPKDAKADKKVQFAKNLEQGPTGSAAAAADKGATVGVKVVQGVTIDDRKIGSGRAVKSGNKVGVRYIGKLQSNGKVFDCKLSLFIQLFETLLTICSQQEGQAVHLCCRQGRSHQGMGYRCCGYVSWWRAPSYDTCLPCVRQQRSSRDPVELDIDIRHQAVGD
jgi:FK506-binding nuclear protein